MSLVMEKLSKPQLGAFKQLYFGAFPWQERLPVMRLRALEKRGILELYSLMEGDTFKGLFANAVHESLVLVFFFAISPDARGQGCGTQALELLKEKYKDKLIYLEIESPAVPCQNKEQRVRRKAFYLRSGFEDTGLRCLIYGTTMELLALKGGLQYEAYQTMLREVYGELLYWLVRPKRL